MTFGIGGINPFTTFDERATTWGAKEWMAQRVDNLGAKMNAYHSKADRAFVRTPSNLEQLFGMELAKSPQIQDVVNPKKYATLVRTNFSFLTDAIEDKLFFKGQKAGHIIKGVLIDDNIKPIRSLFKGEFEYLGSGAVRLFGLGFMGYDTAKKTADSYESEGTLEAVKTFLKTGVKHLLSWQAAGLGFMFGRALLPAIGKLPIGGIITGTLAAISTGWALDKVLDRHGVIDSELSAPEKQNEYQALNYLT